MSQVRADITGVHLVLTAEARNLGVEYQLVNLTAGGEQLIIGTGAYSPSDFSPDVEAALALLIPALRAQVHADAKLDVENPDDNRKL